MMGASKTQSLAYRLGERAAAPTWTASFLYVLLLSGPPRFRFRDPGASLYGELDLAVVVNIIVWAAAGVWLLSQIRKHLVGKRPPLRLTTTHKWALVFILALAASIPVSYAPAFSAFKVYQVCVLFGLGVVFVQRYGAGACYRRMMLGLVLLCTLIVFFYFVTPDMVQVESETGAPRLVGRAIAETGIVAALAILLVVCLSKKLLAPISLLGCVSLGVLLFYSLTRSAFLVVGVFTIMYLWKRYPGKRMLRPALLLSAGIATAILAGWNPTLSAYRDPETIWTLSDRAGLWSHFITRTLEDSPMLGFGFVAGPRALGIEFHPFLGSGHSIFFEAFVGGGVTALAAFVIVFGLMVRDAVWLFFRTRDRLSFAGVALFVAVFLIGLIGGELDAGQTGFTFWMLVSLLPYLRQRAEARPLARVGHSSRARLSSLEESA